MSSTDQNYASQGDSATLNEPTDAQTPQAATIAPPTSFTPDERLARIFANEGAQDYLIELLSLIQEFKGATNPVSSISVVFNRWAATSYMSGHELRTDFGRVLELLTFLDALSQHHECVLINSNNEHQF